MSISITLLEAFGLYLVRTSALILGSPLLGTGTGFSGYKIALVMSVTVVTFMSTGDALPEEVGGIQYALMCFHEVLMGLFLAFVLQMVMVAVRVAGEIIGTEMSFNMASIVDPGTGISSPLVTQIYEAIFFLGLLSVNGHHWILRALGNSFERAPIGGIGMEFGAAGTIIELFSRMFSAGLVFAGPVLALLILVSVLIGFLSRVVPQINVMEIGFILRVTTGLVGIFVFSPYLAPAMNTLFQELMLGIDNVLNVMENSRG
jgi:flagellar biosynthetic protein FliR